MGRCLGGIILCLHGATAAGSLTGGFKFEKAPPSVALVYFVEETSTGSSPCPVVDQKDKKFVHKMLVGRSGCRIQFRNSDNVDHNIYSKDPKSGVDFDAGLLPPGQTSQTVMNWDPDAVIKIGCKIHPKMQAYIANVSSRYYQIVEFKPSEREAAFTLEKVPDKLTKIKIWFPKQDPIDAELKTGEAKQWQILEKGEPAGVLSLSRP
ncbi:MAG TPA: hypothetical protein VJ385_21655 [Fibrobacteria bacterium]|nr:hypothetical protein [Fibrobacteria bacterium]